MADFSRTSPELPVSQQSEHPPPGSMSFGNFTSPVADNAPPGSADGSHTTGPVAANEPPPDGAKPEMSQQVQEVLSSEIGIATMLNRLKQSVASSKEFAMFLKKRSVLEEDQAKGMRKLCRGMQDSIRHPDHRQGSFVRASEEMLMIHERMAENGTQYALSLHQMHEDLLEVAAVAEKHRKGWKQNGLAAEQRLTDIETAMRKSKAKYDSLAEEYDRVRTGESRQGGRVFGIKGPKSAAQQEEDLLRKVQAADTDYHGKVQSYQSEKAAMVSTTRPEAIKALQDLVRECDSATTLQMQKFASFNEKLLLSNGLVISPLKKATLPGQHSRSLKEVIHSIDNKKDLEDHITSFYTRLPPSRSAEPKYERNPVLNPQANMSMGHMPQSYQQPSQAQQPPPIQTSFPPGPGSLARSGTGTFDTTSQNFNLGSMSAVQRPSSGAGTGTGMSSGPGHERSFSHGALLSHPSLQTQTAQPVRNSAQFMPSQSRFNGNMSNNNSPQSSSGPPQLGALPFQSQQSGPQSPQQQAASSPFQVQPPQDNALMRAPSPPPGSYPAPPTQMFGVPLHRLYERDEYAVPIVLHQCIQAVDLFGLAVEGIYRLSGSSAHVNRLKNLFDTDPKAEILDFRNPENFFHDVNSVAGLLKQFLRELPGSLLTAENYGAFVEAAKHEDDLVRRDSLHAIINGLPDPNYATLRALTLHLHRVMENSAVNRMNSQNLAIVFGPTLLQPPSTGNIADAGWQVRVVDTILQNTYQIFDED
ncbi:hypothetical protein F4780DRAFT_778679 [Xylariomycetidae sp. FL0641]|nr:hypothetical protein F4780DRAFT_778679 [Xylariomycetidae sp. FL0641]